MGKRLRQKNCRRTWKIVGADYMLQRFLESINDKDSKAAADGPILLE